MSRNRTAELTLHILRTRSRHARLCNKAMIRDLSTATLANMPGFDTPEVKAWAQRLQVVLMTVAVDLATVGIIAAGEAPALSEPLPLDPERVANYAKYREWDDLDLPLP